MRRSLLLVIAALVVTVSASPLRAATAAKGEIDQPCTFVSVAQVEKAFGGPVAEPIFNEQFSLCDFHVGDVAEPPGGIVTVTQLFPLFSNTENSAKAAFSDQRAVDQVSEYELVEVDGVGKSAYLNLTTGTIVFHTKKMLIAIQWQPGSEPTEPPKSDQKALTKLAKKAAKNAPT